MRKIKVSVLITTHNRPTQVVRALESVLNQSKLPDEIIIVDDASKIPVSKLVQASDFPVSIRIERYETSQGGNKARNWEAEISSGDILMFLDDDDTWEPIKISNQLSIFVQNPDIGLVYSGRLMVLDTDRDKVLYKLTPKASGQLYPQIFYGNLIGTTSSVAVKKSLFEKVAGFDENQPALQDYELWIRCCKQTIVGHDNSCSVRYTISEEHSQQISGQSNLHLEAVNRILDKYSKEIESQGILKARKIRASMFFIIAKSMRRHSLIKALPWIIKSLLQYPNIKAIGIIIPVRLRQYLLGLSFVKNTT